MQKRQLRQNVNNNADFPGVMLCNLQYKDIVLYGGYMMRLFNTKS